VTTSSAPPLALTSVAAPVEDRLRDILTGEAERWLLVDPRLSEPFSVLSQFVLGGGKRLRPAFCHWAFIGAGGTVGDPMVIDAGAAFELLHAFALMHDDVMDGSSTRRNSPTVHATFEAMHTSNEWNGEARRFGEGVAILVGDLAEVFADRIMSAAPTAAFAIWNELKIELNIGQYLDVLGAARGEVDLESARRISRYKSGKYTIERPLHLGAALAGRLEELREPLSRFGEPLGDAFQLKDDLLGTFGDSDRTGKPVGDDLREGKPTPLLAIARQRANTSQLAVLSRVGSLDLDEKEISTMQSVLVETGASDEIERTISELTEQALSAIVDAPMTSQSIEALGDLAAYVGTRDH